MAIAPIGGSLKKKIITDIIMGFVFGGSLATAYWQLEHVPIVKKREAYYAKLKAEKESEEAL